MGRISFRGNVALSRLLEVMRSSNDHTQVSPCLLALPLALNTRRQPMPKQTEHFNEQFILLAAQGVSVHERRRILRERQRIPALTALSLLVIPHPSEKGEVHEDSGCLSPGSSEEPRSRFSHSSPPSPVVSRRTASTGLVLMPHRRWTHRCY